jgi:hypothetical protein
MNDISTLYASSAGEQMRLNLYPPINVDVTKFKDGGG